MRNIFKSTPARMAAVFFGIFLAINLITRVLLLQQSHKVVSWDASLIGAFCIGILFDIAAGFFATVPFVIIGALLPDRLMHSKYGKITIIAILAVFLGIITFITTAEWFFWDEFGARFNFIAVDYLVWTQEVWGNISQSYPLVPIFLGIGILAALVIFGLMRIKVFKWMTSGETGTIDRIVWPLGSLLATTVVAFTVYQSAIPAFKNSYHIEIAKNGYWSFLTAFHEMELDYAKWYAVTPQEEALRDAKKLLTTANEASSATPDDLRRTIQGRGEEHRWNVILVCMESMSGEYMSYVGKNSALTPNLNRLAEESIFFENLYATGTRTVRGMEAITLNLPPTPGQAIIYRPEGTDLVTTFTPFLNRGYDCAFFYGGDGRFDYMNRYFSTSGCRIMDVTAWKPSDVTFKTAWGASDEDLFHKTMQQADESYAAGKPFHYFCMTTSNHRPYLFPEGRIDAPQAKRASAVKYADWAIGNLIEEAQKKPWFKDTLIVICSDHCASSAGKAELNVPKYRIPAMIYNPTLVKAQKITKLCSQIDFMPTVFGQLNWSYQTLGYGHDLLAPAAAETPGRAFVSNYQKLGLLTENSIAILNPNRRVAAYNCDPKSGTFSEISPEKGDAIIHDATTYYQSASWLFKSGRIKKSYQSEPKTLEQPR